MWRRLIKGAGLFEHGGTRGLEGNGLEYPMKMRANPRGIWAHP
jgi:hypothetical protein